jgi:DNA-binding CsgD family transcriptional regulator
MSVWSVLRPMHRARAGPAGGWGPIGGSGMGFVDAAAVVTICVGVVVLLALTNPGDALIYLLAFPVWIVSKDLGALAGAGVAVFALLCVAVAPAADGHAFGPLGYVGLAAVLVGAIVAGGQAVRSNGGGRVRSPSTFLRVLTARPEINRRSESLSRRELQILETIATGAKNAEIADRFVISQNTVKSHVSQILKKLSAANRTEAAFRYVELYGSPSSSDEESAATNGDPHVSDRIGAAAAVSATVAAVRRKDTLVLRLEDGRELDVPVLDELRDRVEVGASVMVYFDQRDRMVGWYLPAEELGVDLRHWAQ